MLLKSYVEKNNIAVEEIQTEEDEEADLIQPFPLNNSELAIYTHAYIAGALAKNAKKCEM